jgi:hypothetical protein
VAELDACEHDKDGFALWTSLPGRLPCGFCDQAAQVLTEESAAPAAAILPTVPATAVLIAEVSDDPGAHFYLCEACADDDSGSR